MVGGLRGGERKSEEPVPRPLAATGPGRTLGLWKQNAGFQVQPSRSLGFDVGPQFSHL